ncbi:MULTISPECIES: hypothetical protein [Mycobacterium]|uniref:Uncharacterized protein n=1 Tax=Mycobacterium paraffinicum TaxID=53378 RepID=A0A1Q4HP27_9MYCO|nr:MULTISPECIES: hypothetical protein [Mycobacterium]OCB26052.1 hypothetical protein A5689_11640 [Mycobacterium intracellulare subsp. yongonense]OJZ69449.1 hypothetical protein BRW65_22845 [Mycobacterium paraffinicum]
MPESRAILKLILSSTILLALVGILPQMVRTASDMSGLLTQPAAHHPVSTPPPAATPDPPIDWVTPATIGLGILIAALLILGTSRYLTSRRVDKRAQQERRAAQIQLWQQGVTTLADTSEALMAFENDPESVYFTRRLLGDITEPATAAFYTAFGTAQALCTETVPADTDMVIAFVDAAAAARRAFGAADENARRKARLGISHGGRRLTPDERHKIDQAQKLMRQARDPAVTEENAHNALTKALNLLDDAGAIIPERLTANTTKSIETVHRRALTR